MTEKFNYVIALKGNKGYLSTYNFGNQETLNGTLKQAKESLEYVIKRSEFIGWKIYKIDKNGID